MNHIPKREAVDDDVVAADPFADKLKPGKLMLEPEVGADPAAAEEVALVVEPKVLAPKEEIDGVAIADEVA